MNWELLSEKLPLELIELIFSFLTIKSDLKTLIDLVASPSRLEYRVQHVVYNRILKFVVIDPSCWVKEFTSEDYWYPTMNEFEQLISAIDLPITSNIQLCIHHNFEKNKLEIETLANFLGVRKLINIKCRLYMKDRFENICNCVSILKENQVLHRVTHLELVSTSTNVREVGTGEIFADKVDLELNEEFGKVIGMPFESMTEKITTKSTFPQINYP